MIDTHCHLTHHKLAGGVDFVVRRAREAGLDAVVTIGTGVRDARACLELTATFPGYVFATAGLDPFSSHRAGADFDDELRALRDLLDEGGFVAVGEIGLDYHYTDLDAPAVQRERFARQLEMARELDLPVVIHVREAHEDMAAVLADHPGVRGVIHSFTAGPAEAERYVELGWMIAFNGIATFPKSSAIRDAARATPLDRIVFETDSPYLAPVPVRKNRCEPAFVRHTLDAIAKTRDVPAERLEAASDANARRLFALPEGGA